MTNRLRAAGAGAKPEEEKFYLNTDHIKLIPVEDFRGFSVVTDNPKITKKRKGDTKMTTTFNRGNEYFDTYNIYNDEGQRIGMLEDHCRQVKKQYFVGWKMDTPDGNTGKTATFDNKEDAIKYSTGE